MGGGPEEQALRKRANGRRRAMKPRKRRRETGVCMFGFRLS
jgi:hypothetical protein